MDDWRGRGKEAVAADARQGTGGRARGEGHPYLMMPTDLVKRVVEACGWSRGGGAADGGAADERGDLRPRETEERERKKGGRERGGVGGVW